jgi:urease accessory protein
MRHISQRYQGRGAATEVLRLPLDRRRHSRLRARLESGGEVGIVLPHGSILRHGDLLIADDGTIVWVEAAPEHVSVVRSRDWRALARAAYHLGNRHVPVELGEEPCAVGGRPSGWLRYQHDHVLDDMVRSLGLEVGEEEAPFEPEVGPYTRHEHPHSHS